MDGWRLSEALGRRVLDRDGTTLGRLRDVSVRLGPDRPPVHRLLVRRRRGTAYLLRVGDVEGDVAGPRAQGPLRVRGGTDVQVLHVDPRRPPLETRELLLGRDVVDTQVVDLRGRHLSRVSDVLLRRTEDGLVVEAVDLGLAVLLRRIGPRPLLPPSGALELEWRHLHLTSPRGHLVQLDADTAAFRRLDPSGLAELLTRLSTPRALDVVRALDPAHVAAALHRSHPRTGRRIVQGLTGEERRDLAQRAAHEHARTIRRLGRPDPLPHRRYRRTEGWRLHRPSGAER